MKKTVFILRESHWEAMGVRDMLVCFLFCILAALPTSVVKGSSDEHAPSPTTKNGKTVNRRFLFGHHNNNHNGMLDSETITNEISHPSPLPDHNLVDSIQLSPSSEILRDGRLPVSPSAEFHNGPHSYSPSAGPYHDPHPNSPSAEPYHGPHPNSPSAEPHHGPHSHSPSGEPYHGPYSHSPSAEPYHGPHPNSPSAEPHHGPHPNSPSAENHQRPEAPSTGPYSEYWQEGKDDSAGSAPSAYFPEIEEVKRIREELSEIRNQEVYRTDSESYKILVEYRGLHGDQKGSMVILESFSSTYNVSLTGPPSGLDYQSLTEIAKRTQDLIHGSGLNETFNDTVNDEPPCPFDPWAPRSPCASQSPCIDANLREQNQHNDQHHDPNPYFTPSLSPECMAVSLSYCMESPCDPGCSSVMAPPGMELGGENQYPSSAGPGQHDSTVDWNSGMDMSMNTMIASGLNCSDYHHHGIHGKSEQKLRRNPTLLVVNVHVNYTGRQGHHGALQVFPTRLYFSDTNFSTPQMVKVYARNDDAYVASANVWSAFITHSVESANYTRHNLFHESDNLLNVTVIDDDVPLKPMRVLLSRSRLQIREGSQSPQKLQLYLSSQPIDDAIVVVRLRLGSPRVRVHPPGPYIFSAANASTPLDIDFFAVDDATDHANFENVIGYFAAFSETDPRLFLGNHSRGNYETHFVHQQNLTGEPLFRHNDTGLQGQNEEFFVSRSIANFTLIVEDNDSSGLVIKRNKATAPGVMEYFVDEGGDLAIPIELSTKPKHSVVIQAMSHNPILYLTPNRSNIDHHDIDDLNDKESYFVQDLEISPDQWNSTHHILLHAIDDKVRHHSNSLKGRISLIMRSKDPKYNQEEATEALYKMIGSSENHTEEDSLVDPSIKLAELGAISIPITIKDNDISGLEFVFPQGTGQVLLVKEGGNASAMESTYGIRLRSEPDIHISSNVTVHLTETSGRCYRGSGPEEELYQPCFSDLDCAEIVSSAGGIGGTCLQGTSIHISPSTIVFTRQTWNIAQLVTVTALDDNFVEPPLHYAYIRHDFENFMGDDPGDDFYNTQTSTNEENHALFSPLLIEKLESERSFLDAAGNFTLMLSRQEEAQPNAALVRVEVKDDDVAGFEVRRMIDNSTISSLQEAQTNGFSFRVGEAKDAIESFEIKLNAIPSRSVFISISEGLNGQLTYGQYDEETGVMAPRMKELLLSFNRNTWDLWQKVVIFAEDDEVDLAPRIRITKTSVSVIRNAREIRLNDPNFLKHPAHLSIPTQIEDDDIAAVLFRWNPSNRKTFNNGIYSISTEEGDDLERQPSYQLRLATKPSAPVHVIFEIPRAPISYTVLDRCSTVNGRAINTTLTTAPLAQIKTQVILEDGKTGIQLDFTPDTWSKWATVKVGAIPDKILEGHHQGTVSHRLVSSDPNYNGTTTRSASCDKNIFHSYEGDANNTSHCEPIFLPHVHINITEHNWQEPPHMSSAELDNIGTSLLVTFTGAPTNGVGTLSCQSLFDGMVDKVFDSCDKSGTKAIVVKSVHDAFGIRNKCIWMNKRSLRVVLGRGATLAKGDILQLKDGVVRSSPTARIFSVNQTVTIDSSNVVYPTADIVSKGGQSVGACANVLLDASASHGGGGRPLTYYWSVAKTSSEKNSEIFQNLTDFMDSSISRPYLNIPASKFLLPGHSYSFRVGVKSGWYPDHVSNATVEVRVVGGSLPFVKILGGTHRDVRLSQIPEGGGVNVLGKWGIETCPGSTVVVKFGPPIFFSVSSVETESRSLSPLLNFPCSTNFHDVDSPSCQKESVVLSANATYTRLPITKQKRSLRIPKSAFSPGHSYVVGLLVYLESEPWRNNTAFTTLTIPHSDLIARIAGGISLSVPAGTELILNASASEDPDSKHAQLQYLWSCRHDDIFDSSASICSQPGSIIASATESVLSIPGGLFTAGSKVTFTVEVSDLANADRPSATSTVVRKIVAGTPPVVEIKVASTSRALDNVDFASSSGVRIFNEEESPTFKATVKSSVGRVSYEWSLATDDSDYGGVEGDISSIWSTPSIGLPTVRIKPNMLKGPASYKFILRALDASGSFGESSVVIQINSPPMNGVLSCTPSSGTSQETLFSLETSEWVDTDLPLAYSFFDDGVGDVQHTAQRSVLLRGKELASPQFETKLSYGEDRILKVRVEDNMGASADAFVNVRVAKRTFASEEEVESAVADVMSSLASKLGTGVASTVLDDPGDMFEVIGLLNENKIQDSPGSSPDDASLFASSSSNFKENATKKRIAFRKSILDETEMAMEMLTPQQIDGESKTTIDTSSVLLVMSAVSGATASPLESDVNLRMKGLNITEQVLESVKLGGAKINIETAALVLDTCKNSLDGLSLAADAAALDDLEGFPDSTSISGPNRTDLNGTALISEGKRRRLAIARSREVSKKIKSTLSSLRDAVMTNTVAGEEALALSTSDLSVTIQKVPRKSESIGSNSSMNSIGSQNETNEVPSYHVSLASTASDGDDQAELDETSFELPFSALPDDDDVEVLATKFATNIYDDTETAAGTIGLTLSQSGIDLNVKNLSDAIVIEFPVSPGPKNLAVPKYWNGSAWDDDGLIQLNISSGTLQKQPGKTHLRFSTSHLTDFSATTVVDPSTIVLVANETAVGIIVNEVLGGSSAYTGASSVPEQIVADLWTSSVGNDVDRLAAHESLFAVVSIDAIPSIVSASVSSRPDMSNRVAARAVATAPSLAIDIAIQSTNASGVTSGGAKATVLSIIEMVQNSTSNYWNGKPLSIIFRSVADSRPELRESMIEAVQDLSTTTQTQTLTPGIPSTVTLDGDAAELSIPGGASSTGAVSVSLRRYDCNLVSSDAGMIGRNCIAVGPHAFNEAVELKFAVSPRATSCIKSTDELSDNWAFVGSQTAASNTPNAGNVPLTESTCTISGGFAYVRSRTWSVLSFREGSSSGPVYVGTVPVGPVAFSRDPQTGFLERRGATVGMRAEQRIPNSTLLVPGGRTSKTGETKLLGFAVQGDSELYPSSKGLFFSTGSSIRRVEDISGTSFAAPLEVVAGVVIVTIKGHSLGSALNDIAMILVKGHVCSSVTYVNSKEVGCVSGHPDIVGAAGNDLHPSDVRITTLSSGTSETTPILNWKVRLAEGYSQPIVVSVNLERRPFRPSAIAIDKRTGLIYWSDTLERTIRRARVDGSFIELVASGVVSSIPFFFCCE